MITSAQFMAKMETFERREELEDCSGLRETCTYIREIPWWNRVLLCGCFWIWRRRQYVGYFEVYCGISGLFAKIEAKKACEAIEMKEWQKAKKSLNWLLVVLCKDLPLMLCVPHIKHKPSLWYVFWLRLSLIFR